MKSFFKKIIKDTVDNKSIPEDGSDFSYDQLTPDQSIPGLTDLYFPQKSEETSAPEKAQETKELKKDIADVLLEMGKLSSQKYEQLRQQQNTSNQFIDVESLLSKDELVESDDISKAKAKLCEMPFQYLEPEKIEKQVFEKLDIDFIKSCNIVPIAIEDDCLVVATSEPGNAFAIEDIKTKTQMDVRVVMCGGEDIEKVCDFFKEEEDKVDYCVDDIINDMTEVEVVQEQEEEFEDLERMADQSPVIKFVNYLISNSIHEGASDIHIEPKSKYTKIKYRIDGALFEMMQSPLNMHSAIVSRIKIMSNLDISERRLPQDGKISVIVGGRGIDLRISILPTSHGEKVVIRVLDSKSILLGLEKLGMEPEVTAAFSEQIVLPHGIFLVTGPTGSGKSTTLYSALNQMDGEKLNISTVEDPVEYELDFCSQVQVREKIGMTFASALRALLRQDPDIIMIGEIRDNETARISVQAALTGHLVLSTLHTNDAPSSITRLVNIGIDAYLIAASLNAVLAQRLVRRVCSKCKEVSSVAENMRKYIENAGLDVKNIYAGKGCDACRNTGYAGRVGIYELLVLDDTYREMINKDSSVDNMRRVFQQSKRASLFDDGIKKIQRGLTTIEEVLRVTEIYGKNENEVFVENMN